MLSGCDTTTPCALLHIFQAAGYESEYYDPRMSWWGLRLWGDMAWRVANMKTGKPVKTKHENWWQGREIRENRSIKQ